MSDILKIQLHAAHDHDRTRDDAPVPGKQARSASYILER